MNIHLRFSKHCWQYPILVKLHGKARSSRPEVFRKKGVFENFTNQRCFPVNSAKFSRSTFFLEHSGGCFWKAKSRSSSPELFSKKGVFENFVNQRCFPVNFAKFSRSSFHRTSLVAASEKLKAEAVARRCSVKKVFFESLLNWQENTWARVSFLQP